MSKEMEMTQEREAKILEGAIKTWGEEAQSVVAIEELSELTMALTKWLRHYLTGQGDYEQIVSDTREEMADVGIMLNQILNQMELIFGDPTEEEILKLLRLEQRIEAEADQP